MIGCAARLGGRQSKQKTVRWMERADGAT